MVASIAFILAFTAIALELVYTIGRYFSNVAAQIH